MSKIELILSTKWVYFAYFLPLLLVLTLFYFRNRRHLMGAGLSFIGWLRQSVETGGQASPEKLTAAAILIFAYIPSRLRFAWIVEDPWQQTIGSALDAIFICVLCRIVTPKDIIEMKAGYRIKEEQTDKTPEV